MSTADAADTLTRIGRWIEQDIEARGLGDGDPYLTAEAMARVLNVSRSTADRAMRRLAGSRVLVRRQRAGTIVGPGHVGGRKRARQLDEVIVLMSLDYLRGGLVTSEVMVEALHEGLPQAQVQFHVLSAPDLSREFESRIRAVTEDRVRRVGLILIQSPRDVQLLAQASGHPTVVFGTAYPDADQLSWIDLDQAAAGRVAMRHVIASGFRTCTLLMRDQWTHGDNLLFEGVGAASAGSSVRLRVRSMPTDDALAERHARQAILEADEPVALLCRSELLARAGMRASRELGRSNDDVLVVCLQTPHKPEPFAHVVPTMEVADQIRWIGRRLAEQAAGDGERQFELVPAELCPAEEDPTR